MKKLKVGDRIYCLSITNISYVLIVQRITKTMAICNNGFRFKLDIQENGWCEEIGRNRFSTNGYYIETPELKEQLLRQEVLYEIQHYKYENLSTDELQSILNIINKNRKRI